MDSIISFFTSIIRTFAEFFHFGIDMLEPPAKDHMLKAEFETDQKVLSIFGEGFCIDGKHSLSKNDSFRHAIIIGKSGIGKSTSTFISSLLTMHTSGSSFVIHDPSKELFQICSGHLKAQGYLVKVLDFGDPDRSIGFNPIDRKKMTCPSDVGKISGMLNKTTLKQTDPFWDISSEQLTNIGIRITSKFPEEFQNLANVLSVIKMMGGDKKRINEIVSEALDDQLYLDWKAFISNDPKVQSGIIASSTAALSIFSDEKVALVTSKDTLDFKALRKRKVALFIQNNVSSIQYYNPIISIFFEMFFASLLKEVPKPDEKSIYILLDEFASGLTLPSFSNCISHFRKYRVGCLMGVQSIEQLRMQYQADATTNILSNCLLQMYFSEQSHATAKVLEEMLGRYNFSGEGNMNLTRNLMEANEVRMIGKNKAIIIAGSEKPILAELTPFYDRQWLKLRANLKPPVMVGVGIRNTVTFMQ